jgi:hypothetical protein
MAGRHASAGAETRTLASPDLNRDQFSDICGAIIFPFSDRRRSGDHFLEG